VSRPRSTFFAGFLLLALAVSAAAEDIADSRAVPNASAQAVDQAIYKGFVGNILDAVPMDPLKRVNLQRTNAVVSNTFSARSLGALVGLTNPVLLVGGLLWGTWAATNINPEATDMKTTVFPVDSGGRVETQAGFVALLDSSLAGDDLPARRAPAPGSLAMNSVGDSGVTSLPRSPVMRIWLPQRSN